MELSNVEKKLHEELKEQGFWRYRSYFKWGYCPGYINRDGYLRFIEGNCIMTEQQLYDHLIDVWRPVAQDERDYYCRMAAAGKLV